MMGILVVKVLNEFRANKMFLSKTWRKSANEKSADESWITTHHLRHRLISRMTSRIPLAVRSFLITFYFVTL